MKAQPDNGITQKPTEIGARPTTRPFAFVLMPFDKSFNDVYEIAIKEACQTAGTYCERVDEQIFEGSILHRIYNQISKADIIIADMTGRNANVFYEVGFAHGLQKMVILVTKHVDDIPFDLKHYRHIIYHDGLVCLRKELTETIKHFLQSPILSSGASFFPLALSIEGFSLSEDQPTVINVAGPRREFYELVLHNTAQKTIKHDEYELHIRCSTDQISSDTCYIFKNRDKYYDGWIYDDIPKGQTVFVVKPKRNILPSGIEPVSLCGLEQEAMSITITIATFLDSRDFDVVFERRKIR